MSVSPICSREVIQRIHLCLTHCNTFTLHSFMTATLNLISPDRFSPPLKSFAPFHVIDVGFIKALLWRITSCRYQLIIQEVDLGTPLQYFEACMPQGQASHFRQKVCINGLRPKDFAWCSTPSPLFTPRELYCSTLRVIIIIGDSSRAC